MLIPFHVALPITTNTPQRLLSTTDNLILASMISGSGNTLGNFGLSALTSLQSLSVSRIRLTCDTAGALLFGVYSATSGDFWEIWRSYGPGVRYTLVDDDYQPRSVSTAPSDWLTFPQTNGYTPAFKWATTPSGSAVNVSGEIQVLNQLGNVTGPLTT